VQRTIWGYRNRGLLDNVVFVQTRLINRSGASIDSMFVSQWSDPDIGNAVDDFAGCDTTRDLGYAYNGRISMKYMDGEFQQSDMRFSMVHKSQARELSPVQASR